MFKITLDSSCDCNIEELNKDNISVIFFNYTDGKNNYLDNMDASMYNNFYLKMKEGVVYKTSQINPETYYNFFEKQLKDNLPIIHVSLGSGLSNSINNAKIAVEMLKEKYDNCDIRIIDTKLASLGSVLVKNELIKCRNENLNVSEAEEKVNRFIDNLNAFYTTNTLTYFARGGRLSKIEAFLGNALKVNPILDCDHEGKLRVIEKVKGERKALDKLVNRIKYSVQNPNEQTIYICHADNETKALSLAKRLVNEVGFKDYKIYFMGPIIGAHTGPGLVAAFFFGKKRERVVHTIADNKEELKEELNKLA